MGLAWLFARGDNNEFTFLDITLLDSFFIGVLFSLMNKLDGINFQTFLLLNAFFEIQDGLGWFDIDLELFSLQGFECNLHFFTSGLENLLKKNKTNSK